MTDEVPPVVVAEGSPLRMITLNRPEHRNALNAELHTALVTAFRAAAAEPEVRAIVLTGAGSAFSAGGDFGLIHRMQDDPETRRSTFETSRALFRAVVDLDIPIVAAVNGPAVGAGCSFALMADVVFMADSTYLSDPRVAIGLVSGDGGAVLLPLLAGLPAARAYLLTGDRIPADEAHRLGLVHKVVPTEQVFDEALAFAQRLVALPPLAVRATKRALNLHVSLAASAVFEYSLAAEEQSV
ncbi:MAG TPA: enoyl-CoA hydratase/isomerase family protein, partial [Acidimicrobiia bacterium]